MKKQTYVKSEKTGKWHFLHLYLETCFGTTLCTYLEWNRNKCIMYLCIASEDETELCTKCVPLCVQLRIEYV